MVVHGRPGKWSLSFGGTDMRDLEHLVLDRVMFDLISRVMYKPKPGYLSR